MDREGGQELAARVEARIKPFKDLLRNPIFQIMDNGGSTNWFITVKWREPRSDEQGMMAWQEFVGSGRLNQGFIKWAEAHYNYWLPKNSSVNLEINKIEKNYSYSGSQDWN